jgi:phosphoserine phosphatase
MMTIQTVPIPTAKYMITDLDYTLTDKKMAEGIGKYLLMEQLYKLRFDKFVRGYRGARRIKNILNNGSKNPEIEGLEEFVRVLSDVRVADRKNVYKYAMMTLEKSALPGVANLVKQCKNQGMKTMVVTAGMDTAAEAAAEYFGIDRSVGNRVLYGVRSKNGWTIDGHGELLDVDISISNGKDKLKAMNVMNIPVEESIVVGNDKLDWELMDAAKLSLASPLADEETCKRADARVRNFENLCLIPKKNQY